jgi:hypothetical protein
MSTSDIERDIALNAAHRLRTWMKDTKMRCEVVDIHPSEQIGMIATCLIERLIGLFIILEISPNQAGQLIHDMMAELEKQRSNKDHEV